MDKDLTQQLPDDALAYVLGRLSPRDLAAYRCVCRAWCGVIDAHRLLRTDLLPFSLGGIFLALSSNAFPPFFACPSIGSAISSNVEQLGTGELKFGYLNDHCNGLLLFSEHVVNPATGQWARLPRPPPSPLPPGMKRLYHQSHLMYDPAVSPYYEVLLVPGTTSRENLDRATEEAEWPPSPCVMRLFSSRTGCWEERSFRREGRAMGTVEVMSNYTYNHCSRYSVYWRGALYVQCHQNNFVMRISMSEGNYHLIAPPRRARVYIYDEYHLGKSEKGVYYAASDMCRLHVWFLDESDGQMKWVLKCDREVMPRRARPNHEQRAWLLQCFGEDNYLDISLFDDDEDDVFYNWETDMEDRGDMRDDFYGDEVKILGFHPFKEVVFLDNGRRGVAYHLNTSKVEYLGSLDLDRPRKPIAASFVYTPCWMGEFMKKKRIAILRVDYKTRGAPPRSRPCITRKPNSKTGLE